VVLAMGISFFFGLFFFGVVWVFFVFISVMCVVGGVVLFFGFLGGSFGFSWCLVFVYITRNAFRPSFLWGGFFFLCWWVWVSF